jgi:hypothetical protein
MTTCTIQERLDKNSRYIVDVLPQIRSFREDYHYTNRLQNIESTKIDDSILAFDLKPRMMRMKKCRV